MKKNGFTLVEVMITVAILGLISLGAASLLNVLAKSQQQLTQEIESDTFVGELGKYIRSKEGCYTVLYNKKYPSSSSQTPLSILMGPNGYNGYGAPANATNLNSGFQVSPKLTINQISLKGNATLNQKLETKAQGIAADIYMRSLDIVLEYTQSVGANNQTKSVTFPATVITRSDNNDIISCNEIDYTMESLCSNINGNPVGQICKMSSECRSYGSYISKQCDDGKNACKKLHPGAQYENTFTGASSCPSNSYAVETGKTGSVYSHHASCGKKCSYAVYTQEIFVTCIKCQ